MDKRIFIPNLSQYRFPTESVGNCPGCGSTNHKLVFPEDVSVCIDCDLYFRNPRPVLRSVLKSYEIGVTFDRWQTQLEERKPLWMKRLNKIRKHKSSGTLLDIGTGDGFFLNFAGEYFDVQATEVSASGVKYASGHGHEVLHGGMELLDSMQSTFDAITLWHVFEHVNEPGALLEKIRPLMNQGAILAIAVPNEFPNLLAAKYFRKKRDPFGVLKVGEEVHLTHFTPKVLRRMMNRFGFEVVEFGVDDVHRIKTPITLVKHYLNVFTNVLFKCHFDRAMYVICKAI